jgi:hypothetical protein
MTRNPRKLQRRLPRSPSVRAILHSLRLAERCLRSFASDIALPGRVRLRARRCADHAGAAIRDAGGAPMEGTQ